MILVAPTTYKGTIAATRAADAMAAGARRARPGREVREIPLSDGGPGLLEALERAWAGRIERVRVTGPLGSPVDARILRTGARAVIESAEACGLHRIPPDRRDPMVTTTYGVGEMIARVIDLADEAAGGRRPPVEHLVLGLGGSGTVDGGAGMAQALGWHLLDLHGRPIGRGGAGLRDLSRISRPERSPALPSVTALADVDAPLVGRRGAAAVFAPQKGADALTVRRLELGLARLAVRLEEDLGMNVRDRDGAGAAGGLGAGAVAFLGADLVAGSPWVMRAVGFADALTDAELVVTGEGAFDEQSAMGKVVGKVIQRARARGVPTLVVAGSIEAELPEGVVGADGGGERITPERLESIVAERVPQLLDG